jgi:hypothetical protein
MGKVPKAIVEFDRALGHDWVAHLSERQLLDLGQIVAGTDYAVAHYLHPWHPKFFGQRDLLERAVRRELARRPTDIRLLEVIEALCSDLGTPEQAGSGVATAVLAAYEELRGILLALGDNHLDRFMREIAYNFVDVAEVGDEFLAEWGYCVRSEEDEVAEENADVVTARIADTRARLAVAGAEALLDIVWRIEEHCKSDYVPRSAVLLASSWPLGA